MIERRGPSSVKLDRTLPTSERLVVILSGFAFALITALVLATPFVEIMQVVPPEQRVYRIYGYGLVLALHAVLVPIRGLRLSLQVFVAPLLIVFTWFALSLTWSSHVDLSMRRLILLAAVYIGVTGGVCDLGCRRSLNILRALFATLLAINFVAVLCFHDLATQSFHRVALWQGVMGHKNIAGLACAATILLFATDPGRLVALVRFAVIGAASVFLYMSGSRTPVLALAVGLPLALTLAHLLPKRPFPVPERPRAVVFASLILAGGLVLLLGLTLQKDLLISLTENQAAFSVRNMIWRPMVQFYVEHPLGGSGYGAYWDGQIQASGIFGDQEWMRNVDQGHNGYLDLLVQTGFPGLTLALGVIVLWPLRRFAAMHAHDVGRASLAFALVAFMMVENLFESSLLADDALGNLLLLFALAQIHRFELRSRSPSGRGASAGDTHGNHRTTVPS